MRTHNIPFQCKKESHPKSSQICSYGTFSKGLKNEFETALVNEPSMFESLKFYCIFLVVISCLLPEYVKLCFETVQKGTVRNVQSKRTLTHSFDNMMTLYITLTTLI